MDVADQSDFRLRLVTLGEVFDKKLSPQMVALYFGALRDLPLEAVIGAMNTLVTTAKFFPKPVEIRTLVLGDSETHEESAWITFRSAMGRIGAYSSVSIEDAALAESVIALFGSWPAACTAELSSEMWASKRKEFSRVYRVFLGRKVDGPRYLPGTCELTNGGRQDCQGYVPVGTIGVGGEVRRLSGTASEHERTAIAVKAHEFARIGSEGSPRG